MNGMLQVIALCLAGALVCMSLRTLHPGMAAAAAAACGAGVMLLMKENIGALAAALRALEGMDGGAGMQMLKICGLALLAEFAADICRDAGEAALARRIDVGLRLGVCAAALPAAAQIMEEIMELMA